MANGRRFGEATIGDLTRGEVIAAMVNEDVSGGLWWTEDLGKAAGFESSAEVEEPAQGRKVLGAEADLADLIIVELRVREFLTQSLP